MHNYSLQFRTKCLSMMTDTYVLNACIYNPSDTKKLNLIQEAE
jgi:hypothetical protein